MSAKEPLYRAHEINRDIFGEELFELAFDRGVGGEVNEVIDVDAKGNRDSGWSDCRVRWIDEVPSKQAGVRCVGLRPRLCRMPVILLYQW